MSKAKVNNPSIFFLNVKRLSEQKGMSISAVVDSLNISRAAASGWKNGSIPQNETAKTIADFFGVTIEQLLTNQDDIAVNSVQNNYGIVGHANAPVTISNGTERTLSDNEVEMLRMFTKLAPIDQARAMVFTSELLDKQK
jgi:transcriptional regulator with XRE-family HTH domain